MARTRQVRHGFWLSEDLLEIEETSGLGAVVRFTFIGLMALADREGRFTWTPRKLRAQIDPGCSYDFVACMEALVESGHVDRYDVEGRAYGEIQNFKVHQTIHPQEAKSKIPGKPNETQNGPNETQLRPKLDPTEIQLGPKCDLISEKPRNRETEKPEEEADAAAASPPRQPQPGEPPIEAIRDAYNRQIAEGSRWSECSQVGKTLRREIRDRWDDYGGPSSGTEAIAEAIRRVSESEFLLHQKTGETSILWLFHQRNFEKVMTGAFDDNAPSRASPQPRQSASDQIRLVAEGEPRTLDAESMFFPKTKDVTPHARIH